MRNDCEDAGGLSVWLVRLLSGAGGSGDREKVKLLVQLLYGLIGVVFLSVSATVLLLGTGLVPNALADIVIEFGDYNAHIMHLVQEYCTMLFFIGLVNLWCVWNYERSRFFHWAMTAFWGLFALVHWFDYQGAFHSGMSQALDTLPLAIFVVVGILRERFEWRNRDTTAD